MKKPTKTKLTYDQIARLVSRLEYYRPKLELFHEAILEQDFGAAAKVRDELIELLANDIKEIQK